MNGTTLIIRWNWQKLFSYGEVVCFVSAWAIGLLVALQSQRATIGTSELADVGLGNRHARDSGDALALRAF